MKAVKVMIVLGVAEIPPWVSDNTIIIYKNNNKK